MSRPVLTARLARVALRGAIVAAASALPAALRAFAARESGIGAWLAAAGARALPACLAVIVARAAWRGLAELARGRAAKLAAYGAAWLALVVPLDAALGAVLRATTHHRGLAGATYGAGALVVAVACALLAWRAVSGVDALLVRVPARAAALAAAALAIVALVVAAPAARVAIMLVGAGRPADALVDAVVAVAVALVITTPRDLVRA